VIFFWFTSSSIIAPLHSEVENVFSSLFQGCLSSFVLRSTFRSPVPSLEFSKKYSTFLFHFADIFTYQFNFTSMRKESDPNLEIQVPVGYCTMSVVRHKRPDQVPIPPKCTFFSISAFAQTKLQIVFVLWNSTWYSVLLNFSLLGGFYCMRCESTSISWDRHLWMNVCTVCGFSFPAPNCKVFISHLTHIIWWKYFTFNVCFLCPQVSF
jgi:hypothetical protein